MGKNDVEGTGRTSLLERLKQRARGLQTQTFALYLAYRDPRTPWFAKAWAMLVVAYALSPIDLIPDFIPILGYLDDLILIPAGIALALKMIPAEVMVEAREKAQQVMGPGVRVGWMGMVMIFLIWLLALALIVVLILRLWYVNNKAV